MDRKLITARRLAKTLDVDIPIIYEMAKSGRIPFYWVGKRRYRFDEDEVLRCLKGKSKK